MHTYTHIHTFKNVQVEEVAEAQTGNGRGGTQRAQARQSSLDDTNNVNKNLRLYTFTTQIHIYVQINR